jgi:hypothetical protein
LAREWITMRKNPELVKKFEDRFLEEEGPLEHARALKIFTALWQEALTFGLFPPRDPLEGIETDLKIARILNTCLKKSFPD